jgi:tetratricopeptide (TPR) repeat protein
MPPDGGSWFWAWFRHSCLTSLFFWWIAFIALCTLSYPFIARFRAWQARRRFIRSHHAQLENPQNADARFQLAELYAKGRNWRKTEDYAAEAVRVAKENPLYEGKVPYHFWLLLGKARAARKRHAEAIDAFRQALEVRADLGHGEARFLMAKSCYRRGEFAKAYDAYVRAFEDNASNLELYFRFAQAAARIGKGREAEEARAQFRRVAATLPAFAGRRRFRWRLAFWLFPIARWIA